MPNLDHDLDNVYRDLGYPGAEHVHVQLQHDNEVFLYILRGELEALAYCLFCNKIYGLKLTVAYF